MSNGVSCGKTWPCRLQLVLALSFFLRELAQTEIADFGQANCLQQFRRARKLYSALSFSS